MSIKFGGKQSMVDKVKVASRNKNPKGGKDKIGFKVTRKF